MWEDHEDEIKEAWNRVGWRRLVWAQLKKKKRCYGDELLAWGSTKTDPNVEEIKSLQKRIEGLIAEDVTPENRAKFLGVSKRLDELLLKQEMYWAQRSTISWLKYGDKNTKFFHSKASQRRRRNHIEGIRNVQNQWMDDMEDIAKVASDYFEDLFSARLCDQMDECLEAIPCKVNPNMQNILSNEFNVEEIKLALF